MTLNRAGVFKFKDQRLKVFIYLIIILYLCLKLNEFEFIIYIVYTYVCNATNIIDLLNSETFKKAIIYKLRCFVEIKVNCRISQNDY